MGLYGSCYILTKLTLITNNYVLALQILQTSQDYQAKEDLKIIYHQAKDIARDPKKTKI